jgi:hypothetical protein
MEVSLIMFKVNVIQCSVTCFLSRLKVKALELNDVYNSSFVN